MATLLKSTGVLRPREEHSPADAEPIQHLATAADLVHWSLDQSGTALLGGPDEIPQATPTVASYVQGVSLANVLQMLNLERMTCLLEVTADGQFGTLTLVNGELVDANVNELDGEEAVYAILAWRHPHTTILDGVTLFRNTVKTSLTVLIVEAAARQDEAERDPRESLPPAAMPEADDPHGANRADASDADWAWLVETLVISGASAAAVVRLADERVLAQASEWRLGAQGAANEELGELAPVVRAAIHWGRHTETAIDDIMIRLGDRYALIAPLDPARTISVCATFAEAETITFARTAVRALMR